MTFSAVFFMVVIVAVIYNAEKMPQVISKLKDEVPHIVDAGKKASKELKEKAQAAHKEKMATKKKSETEQDNSDE